MLPTAPGCRRAPAAIEARADHGCRNCPTLHTDKGDSAMTRARRQDDKFPRCCAVAPHRGRVQPAPASTGIALPAAGSRPPAHPGGGRHRLPHQGRHLQACNDPAAWPFPPVARAAAALKPDLVIHVGDYLYRENPCPAGNAGCAGSPWGDNWTTWNADFFDPAAPLLAAAPIVLVRGNHEDCARAGPGWLRLQGPLAYRSRRALPDPCAAVHRRSRRAEAGGAGRQQFRREPGWTSRPGAGLCRRDWPA